MSGTAEPVILEVSGFPIGFFEGVHYEEHSVAMKPGDRLYLYSDGVTEALNRKGQEFGKERLIHALDQSRSGPLKESVASLLETIEECCDARLEDDISVLAIEITP